MIKYQQLYLLYNIPNCSKCSTKKTFGRNIKELEKLSELQWKLEFFVFDKQKIDTFVNVFLNQ